ncbi:hypothetical protein OAE04_00865 [bacterium]|nr:hypothetical protein [Vicingaceae bacterium]MDB4062343.1 hypothetical protein [Vicingaceae bacterium]MDC0004902.1 hypothetical protein [bacterium]
MTKSIFTLLAFIAINITLFSQDVITLKAGEDIQAKILELSTTEIKFKKFGNQTGPTFTILKSTVLMVRYENGTKDIFNQTEELKTPSKTPNEDMRMKGRRDAEMNYTGKKSGAGWTAATTILFSPLIGLIPAAACASSAPNDENLNYRDYELMKDFEYNKAYAEQAHKIKKKKVWKNFGVGSGAWLILILLL